MNVDLTPELIAILIIVSLWSLPWKGIALWKSARNGDKKWFTVLLLVNTLALLEIFYIFVFSKKIEQKNIT